MVVPSDEGKRDHLLSGGTIVLDCQESTRSSGAMIPLSPRDLSSVGHVAAPSSEFPPPRYSFQKISSPDLVLSIQGQRAANPVDNR